MRIERAKQRILCRWMIAVLMLAAGLVTHAQSGGQSLVNRKAPEFARRDLSGRDVSLALLRGKVVLLSFWATWCAPCEKEMPVFAAWQKQYAAQGFRVVGISMDDDEAEVQKAVKKLRVDYPVAMGDAGLGNRYGGVLGLPMTFLIDRSGVVRAQYQGEVDLKKIDGSLKDLLSAR